jgi:hypothetical protein
MRVQFVIALAATMIAQTAIAQNSTAATSNSATAATSQKAETAKAKKAAKPVGDKICKRLSQGKVCMTADQWKAYQEQF